ncbi:hypothetical protein [Bacillus massilinigeriensis]|uniref:hypothetical protein n=1 Tax=Bacillus mediterraneensis TaxID=1805474 RepID=UPI0008F81B56|nr:hypothetical protein [Bacillus mediterraneensis]
MENFFKHDKRLGIPVPDLLQEWEAYSSSTQDYILFHWERIRGSIPDRIAALEHVINQKQAQLDEEMNFKRSCELNSEIAELASVINELWLWYRTNQDISGKAHR